jgi:hypothetical protein
VPTSGIKVSLPVTERTGGQYMGITGWGDPSLIPISALARRGSARGHYGLIAACADRGRDSDVCDHHTEAEFNDQASQYTVNPLTFDTGISKGESQHSGRATVLVERGAPRR